MIQTYCELHGIPEVHTIEKGMDLRRPEVRKEAFIRFYEFHTRLGIHPDLVYLFLPELVRINNWTMEQKLWFAFLEGCSQNIFMAWFVIKQFPNIPRTNKELDTFEQWHSKNWRRLFYDEDNRYNKGHLVEQLKSYLDKLDGRSQEEFFGKFLYDKDKTKWFDNIWQAVVSLYKFGRLTAWSYIEFIKIASGYDFRFSKFFMEDPSGSKSIRNGVLYILGREELEIWKGANNGIQSHSRELSDDLDIYAQNLTKELQQRYCNESWAFRIGYETVESVLCVFKKYFHGTSYQGIYCDDVYGRLKKYAQIAPEVDFSIFWEIRKDKLPKKLLLEENTFDPGLCTEKKTFFKRTGHMPMISVLDPVFECEWDTKYYGSEVDTFFN